MLSVEEQRALFGIDAELTRRHPELAAALTFGHPPLHETRRGPTRARRLRRVLFALATTAVFAFAWLWSTVPPGPCPAGRGMTNHEALSAAADPSRPMPDNIGCVVPPPKTSAQ